MPSISPVEAGRKGGKSRSVAKVAAAKRNGFQRVVDNQPSAPPPAAVESAAPLIPRPEIRVPALFVSKDQKC